MSVDGLKSHLKQITNDVILFEKASRLVFEKSEAVKYSAQEANNEAACASLMEDQKQPEIHPGRACAWRGFCFACNRGKVK